MDYKKIYLIIIIVILSYLIYSFLTTFYFLNKTTNLIDKTKPFNQNIENPDQKILVVGDSIAYGVGTTKSEKSISGRLGEKFPNSKITTRAENGLTTSELLEDKEKYFRGDFDKTVIIIGANDIIWWKNLEKTTSNIKKIIKEAENNKSKTYFYTSGKIGEAPVIPWYLKPIYNKRSLTIRNKAKRISKEHKNTEYIDLISDGKDIFSGKKKYYAKDLLHLSDKGYKLWFERLDNKFKK